MFAACAVEPDGAVRSRRLARRGARIGAVEDANVVKAWVVFGNAAARPTLRRGVARVHSRRDGPVRGRTERGG